MKYLQRIAIDRPVTTAMFYLLLILLGLISLKDLEVNLLPDMEFPRLTVITNFQNAAPEEVENLITKPLTEAVGTVKGIEKISSESMEGVSFVTLQFGWGNKIDYSAMEVREKIDLIRGILPEDAGKPIVTKFDPSQSAIQEIVFFPVDKSRSHELRGFIKREIKSYLDRVDGVALAQISGGFKKEILIEVDPSSMYAHQISIKDIQGAVESSNINYPAGHIEEGSKDVLIRTMGEYRDFREIEKTNVSKNDKNIPIRLGSIAQIHEGYKERKGLARYNGEECVTVSIYKESGKNTVTVSESVRSELERLKEQYKNVIKADIVYEESRFVKQSIDNITGELISGGLLAFLSLIFILRNMESPLILLTVLPISVITTFLLMYLKDLTLNVMTLGGLSLGIGMLFDSGNVVLAAIERHVRNGLSVKEASLTGANEVAGSITSAVLTTVIIFLPIVFLKGIIGVVFGEMALTITFSLLVSLAVSLTLIPMLSALRGNKVWSRKFDQWSFFKKVATWENEIDVRFVKGLTNWLGKPKRFFTGIAICFVVVLILISYVDKEFIPKVDTGEFKIEILNVKGSSLSSTSELVEELETKLLKEKEVKHVISNIGYDEEQILSRSGGEVGTHQAQIRVVLSTERSEKTKDFIHRFREKIQHARTIGIHFYPEEDMLSKILSPDSKAVTLEIEGNDLATLAFIGENVRNEISKIQGITDSKSSLESENREFQVRFDEDKMSVYGLSHQYLAGILKTALKGTVATRLRINDEEFDVRLRYRQSDRKYKKDISGIIIRTPSGDAVFLDQAAEIREGKGYASILRIGQSRVNRITANVENVKQSAVISEVEEYIERLKLPVGYKIHFGGEKENIDSSMRELLFAFVLAVVLIYMLLAGQFESLLIPLIMLCTIPLILIGIIPALLITGNSFNISSFTGIILLVGIVVDNAALFYEYVEILEHDQVSLKEAIIGSGQIVLRPIIMNNGTTLLGLLPVALELGEGTEFQSPMAVTVISGLAASVVLSLFLIPIAFYYILKWQRTRRKTI
ncbi:efflux RND transporter permease subunit [Leptospira interrogans]|nr:efflux RND transporter permease subunit [Leptospira interrogans]ASV06428.1 AcrB/AcrD/AcrF family protein [Leptospira interrogans serovar Canicola]OLZ32363.1 acriflavin resistance protein [Leptospira interrogans serovar Canicola]POR17602.1 acriflavin resistance protein [Leptospira interrogans serovar Canicola]